MYYLSVVVMQLVTTDRADLGIEVLLTTFTFGLFVAASLMRKRGKRVSLCASDPFKTSTYV